MSGFLTMLGQATDDEFEKSILPLSRVPGLNVLVMAGLLVQELPDPMEVLSWVGADIHNSRAVQGPTARRTSTSTTSPARWSTTSR